MKDKIGIIPNSIEGTKLGMHSNNRINESRSWKAESIDSIIDARRSRAFDAEPVSVAY